MKLGSTGDGFIKFYVCFLGLLIGHRHSSNREGTLTEFLVSVPHEQTHGKLGNHIVPLFPVLENGSHSRSAVRIEI